MSSQIQPLKRRLGLILSRYVVKEFLFSLLVAFLFFFFLFFINQLLVIARDVLSKQVDIPKTLLLILYAMPIIIALAIPFASLVGTIMALGRLSSDNEIVALQACGINLIQIFKPILVLAMLLAGLSFLVNDVFLPLGTINYRRLQRELLYTNSELVLQPYSIGRFNDTQLISSQVDKDGFGSLLLIDTDEEGKKRFINAKSGKLLENSEQSSAITLNLDAVDTISISENRTDYDFSSSDQIEYNLLLKNISNQMLNTSPMEMSSLDVYDRIQIMEKDRQTSQQQLNFSKFLNKQSIQEKYFQMSQKKFKTPGADKNDLKDISTLLDNQTKLKTEIKRSSTLQRFLLEFWKKFSIPAACITLIFLGFPAGIFAKRSGRSIGFGVGFIIAVIFYAMILTGQSLGASNVSLPPFLLMWAPNLIFFVIGLVLLIRRITR